MMVYIVTAAVVIMVVIFVVMVIKCYNKLTVLKNMVDNQASQIDVQLKRKAELIPNLVETTKGYSVYEKETLEEVVRLRGMVSKADDTLESYRADHELTKVLHYMSAVCERYPELKANANYLKLQEELSATEDKISKARQFYNDVVTKYNVAIMTFPQSLFAKKMGFLRQPLLEVPDKDTGNIKIHF